MSDAEKTEEIEITPEMIEAGVDEAVDWRINETAMEVWLPEVFRAMAKIWLQQRRESR